MNRVEKRTSRNKAAAPTSNNSSNTAPRAATVSVELLQGGRVLRSLKPPTVIQGGGSRMIRQLLDVIRGGGRLVIRHMVDPLSSPLSLLL